MYCDLNDAYGNICDLTQSQTDCVYDNIVNDGVDIKKDHIPRNMFTAQGDYYEYSPIQYNEDIINQTNAILDNDTCEKGTTIAELRKQQNNINKSCVQCPQEDTPKLVPNNDNKENKNSLKISGKYIEQETLEKKMKKIIQDVMKEHFTDSQKPDSKAIKQHNYSRFHSLINSDIVDAVLITFIGIIILFLLDILVRISKKL
jgi:hypothetical protein